jgi:hypothetical protein
MPRTRIPAASGIAVLALAIPGRALGHVDADAIRYKAPSGSEVFASGSIRFAVALDDLTGHGDPRLQRFMRNALNDLAH